MCTCIPLICNTVLGSRSWTLGMVLYFIQPPLKTTGTGIGRHDSPLLQEFHYQQQSRRNQEQTSHSLYFPGKCLTVGLLLNEMGNTTFSLNVFKRKEIKAVFCELSLDQYWGVINIQYPVLGMLQNQLSAQNLWVSGF